jgi:hypothetical protein
VGNAQESSSGCRGSTSNYTDPCEPTLTGVYCRQCRHADQYYVPASSDAKANCTKCGATFLSTFGIAVGAIVLIFIPKKRAIAVLFGRLSINNKKRMLSLREGLTHVHATFRLDHKLKTLIGFYMIATKARALSGWMCRMCRILSLPSPWPYVLISSIC